MGIKGRRKRQREREQMAAAESAAAAAAAAGEHGSDEDDERVGGALTVTSSSSSGPMQPPLNARGELKLKKTELYTLHDEEYLERLREQHRTRRQSHLRGLQQHHRRGGGGAGEDEDEDEGCGGGRRVCALPTAPSPATAKAMAVAKSLLLPPPPSSSSSVLAAKDDSGGTHSAATVDDEAIATTTMTTPVVVNIATGGVFAHPLLGLDAPLTRALRAEGFVRMTRIQERCVPYLLDGYDVLAQARTGSGKTLAFCVPVLQCVVTHNTHGGSSGGGDGATLALLLAPTKELCVQTYDMLQRICQHLDTSSSNDDDDTTTRALTTTTSSSSSSSRRSMSSRVCLITGGTKVADERRTLSSGVAVVVGTPGRVRDHALHSAAWSLAQLRFLVLDEADRMLAEGFQRDLDAILARLPRSRQTCLFSATNSKSVHELARLSLARTPIFVRTTGDRPTWLQHQQQQQNDEDGEDDGADVATSTAVTLPPYRSYAAMHDDTPDDDDNSNNDNNNSDNNGNDDNDDKVDDAGEAMPSTLRQYVHFVPLEERLLQLYVFVKRVARRGKAMVFCSTVASTIFHCQMMASVGFHDDVVMLHGHMKHRQRVQTFRLFRDWPSGVLFCTDVAARGLDIACVQWILQYDPPLDPTEYIHRVGRTARAGAVGHALLFLTPEEAGFVAYLHRYGLRLHRYAGPARLPAIHEKLEHVLQLDPIVAKSAVTAYRAHVAAYQSHILRDTFSLQRLDLTRLARAFALTSAPHVTLPRNADGSAATTATTAADAARAQTYVKGRLRSLNRRRTDALRQYEALKTRPQWSADGTFIGLHKPT